MKATTEALQLSVATDGVTRALNVVRQLASRPTPLVDAIALIAALEQLADAAQDANHQDRAKYNAIFKQCRPLVNNPRLPAVVVRLLGDEGQKEVSQSNPKDLAITWHSAWPDITRGRIWLLAAKCGAHI